MTSRDALERLVCYPVTMFARGKAHRTATNCPHMQRFEAVVESIADVATYHQVAQEPSKVGRGVRML